MRGLAVADLIGPLHDHLQQILVAAKLLDTHGGTMKICDANASVKRVMEVSGIGSLLHLYDTEQDALAAFA